MQNTVSTATIFPWSCVKVQDHLQMQDHHVCSCPSVYCRLPRSFLPPQNISSSMTKRHNIGPRRGAVPCRGCYDYCLRKMTPTDVLLASPWKEDENKKKPGTFLPGGGLAVRGTMARHSYIILELLSTL